MTGIVVVGAGQAGASLVEKLRVEGYDGDLTLIGEEVHLPYQRPPLSKKYLMGEMDVERLYLRPLEFYADKDVVLRTGTKVASVDAEARSLTLDSGEVLSYEKLALATGSQPIRLPGSIGGDLKNVYTVRTLSDVDAMVSEFVEGQSVLIVGGGYIGLEAAAVAARLGLKVTLAEMADRILKRVAAPETSDFFRELHATYGVSIMENTGLTRLIGEGRAAQAELSDGQVLDVDFVIVGVGIRPETALADAMGLDVDNGIVVDAQGRSSDPAVFAAGDCTSFPYQGGRIRLESVPNAIEQAGIVAKAMLGKPEEYVARPWFWSDQYDLKLQIAGLNAGYDRTIRREGARAGTQSVWYFKGDKLLAVDAMNDPRAYMTAKRWIEADLSPDPEQIGDLALELKTLAVS